MANFSLLAKLGLDSKGFQTGIDKADKKVKKFSKSALSSITRVAGAFAGIGLVKSIVGLGTAAAETASKFKAVFGPATDEMNKKVQELRQTIPSTTAEMQNALATFAQMAKAFGLNEEAANMFSVEMVKIAGDIASFNNLPIEEAFTKIRSAISGEFEPMKQLGIVINEARLEQEALNIGVSDGTQKLSAAQKALAVQSILIRDMGDANGDAAATAASAANQIKFLQKDLKEMGTEIGVTVLPSLVKLTEWTSGFISGIKGAAEAFGEFIGKLAFTGGKSIEQFEAELQLESEGAFEGKSKRGSVRKKIIDKRVAEIKAQRDAEKKAEEEKRKADEEALKNASDLESELQKQAELEKDPARKKALEERLKAYRDLLDAAGKLEGIGSKKTGGGKTVGTRGSMATGGISSFAAIAGGGRVGTLKPLSERQLSEATKQTKVLEKIEKNTAKNLTPSFM